MFNKIFPIEHEVKNGCADEIKLAQTKLYKRADSYAQSFRASFFMPISVLLLLFLTKKEDSYDVGIIILTLLMVIFSTLLMVWSYYTNVKTDLMARKLKHHCILLIFLQFSFSLWTSIVCYIVFVHSSQITFIVSLIVSWLLYFIVCCVTYRLSYKKYCQIIIKSASNMKFYLCYSVVVVIITIAVASIFFRMVPRDVLLWLACFATPCFGIALSRSIMDYRYYIPNEV